MASETYIANLLAQTGLFNEEQVGVLAAEAAGSDLPLGQVVAANGAVREGEFLKALGSVLQMPYRTCCNACRPRLCSSTM
jgi:hypothetical protein